MSDTQTPTLDTILNRAARRHLKNLRVALPARVESYDAATQKVSVQPLILDGYTDDGERVTERLPVIPGVPVVFPGAGGFRITFPLAVGDTVLVVFTSSSIDRWLAVGGEVDPGDDRRHDINDAVAIPGLRDFAHALTGVSTTAMQLTASGGDATIEIDDTEIRAGGAERLALGQELLDLRNFVYNQFQATGGHTHVVAGAATTSIATTSGVGTPPAPAAVPATSGGTTVLLGG